MTASFLIGMMITLVAFVLISSVLMRFMSEADNIAAENLCYDSIALRATTAVQLDLSGIDIEGKLIPPLCQTIDKKVSGSKEQVMKEVADSMARCWWMFGAGQYEDILDDIDVDVLVNTDNTENHCFNCYTLMINEDDFDGEEYISSADLVDYMLEHEYSSSGQTYIDYIQDSGGPGRAVFTAQAIAPNEGYTISFVPKLGDSDDSFWGEAGKIATGVILVGVAVGGVACAISTAGLCGAVIVGSIATTTTVASVAVGGVGIYTEYAALEEAAQKMFEDPETRETSSVFLSYQGVGEEMCPDGDLAGE